jgi:DNA-binding IclR family transcriptional regulator
MKPKNSLERVLAVLEVFSEERLEWTPEDLMRELGYSRPTLYRYLKILKDAGFLMSTRDSGVTLGPKVVEMDYLTRRSDPLVLRGVPYLKQLTAAYSCTAMVLRWYGNKILCVASESSTKKPISSYPRGRPMPLGRGAIARSILALLPRPRLVPLIERNLADLRAVGLGDTADDVLKSLRKVRKAGFRGACCRRPRLSDRQRLRHHCRQPGDGRADRSDQHRRPARGVADFGRSSEREGLKQNLILRDFS